MSPQQSGGDPNPAVLSVNVGRPRTVEWHGRMVTSAIWKAPVEGPIALEGVNLRGDEQADRRVHGGPDKAVYAYAHEDYAWWAAGEGTFKAGTFGENLTTVGIDLGASQIGDRWHVGTTVLEVAQPRTPCFKLAIRMNDESFPEKFDAAKRPGAYLRILQQGTVAAGDAITIERAEQPAIPLLALISDDADIDLLERATTDHRVPDGWRRAARRVLRAART